MPSTQVNTPEVEAEVVSKEDSPVKKSLVEEKIIADTGDEASKVEEKTDEVEQGEKDKNGVNDENDNGENEESENGDSDENGLVEESNEETKEEDTNGVDKVVEEKETKVDEPEVENGKRKSLSLEGEAEISPKKLKTDSEAQNEDDNTEESVTASA